MSNAVSALNERISNGPVTISELGLQGMITLRGDLSSRKLQSAVKSVTGLPLPEQGKVAMKDGSGLAWMSPDEVLVMTDYSGVDDALAKIDKALKGQHYLAVNVSDARAVIEVSGPFAREVIAKLAPIDTHPDALLPGDFIRSRLGQVAAAFWMTDDITFRVICFRSVADYVFRLLDASAKAGPVGHL